MLFSRRCACLVGRLRNVLLEAEVRRDNQAYTSRLHMKRSSDS